MELEGRSHLPSIGDAESVVEQVRIYLGLPRLRRAVQTGLTAPQTEVAALVADGLTNREVADRLGITERSAESHLERIRLRLGFRSRSQVTAWYVARNPHKCGSSTAARGAGTTHHGGMFRRHAYLFISAAGWFGFVSVMVWTMAFLAGAVVPRTVDGPAHTTAASAIIIDAALLLLFAAQHSVMARRQVKSWLRQRIPAALERTSYVLATDACLVLLLVLWQPWGSQIWYFGGAAAVVLWALCAAGWVLAIAATFAVDHLELLGLRQAGWAAPRDVGSTGGLRVGGLHAVVRHPLMTGLLLAFCATPRMGASHLLFAVGATGYIAVGMAFEEGDLRRTFGASYDDYTARVPAVVPGLRLPRDNVLGPDRARTGTRRRAQG